MATSPIPQMRTAVRFPLHLPVLVRTDSFEQEAETNDISAGGVLFTVDEEFAVGSPIEFTINIPADFVGALHDVMVKCVGRVVRCSPSGTRKAVAAVIDDYQFAPR